jgi:hypothetical protein
MPAVEFEPTISAGERPQTYVLDRAATGTGIIRIYIQLNSSNLLEFRWLLHKTEAVERPGHPSSQTGPTHNPHMFISWLCYVDS